jgi:hypothetical protein
MREMRTIITSLKKIDSSLQLRVGKEAVPIAV